MPALRMATTPSVEDLVRRALAHHRAGEWVQAEALYRNALAIDPDNLNALQLLGALAFSTYRAGEAVALLERAEKLVRAIGVISPQYSPLYNNLGNALSTVGRYSDAYANYRRSLELSPGNAEVHVNLANLMAGQGDIAGAIENYEIAVKNGGQAEWHYRLGKLYAGTDRAEDAETHYRAALKLNPAFCSALYELGLMLHRRQDLPGEVIELFERLRTADPDHVAVHQALGDAYRRISNLPEAIASYRRHVNCLPDSPDALIDLGSTLSEAEQHDEALVILERAIELDKIAATRARVELADALLRAKRPTEAREQFMRALAIRPFITYKSIQDEPRFSALLLVAPGYGNTPYGFLFGQCKYDIHIVPFFAESGYDASLLQSKADVVVNLISEADQGRLILPVAGALIDRLAKPTVNHPAKILPTDRVTTAQKLKGVAGCRAAQFHRFSGEALLADTPPKELSAFRLPFLARVVGLHGGEDFEKIEDMAALRAFVSANPAADYYVTDYLDYQSPDGFFRKYRFFCVDGALLPYHLAIGSHWKVHHINTDMANQVWMQQEEKAFLARPEAVFCPRQMASLDAIRNAIGLDFMGIDCGLDRDGNVVLFEVNATMLVNGNNHAFPYKTPYVRKIKTAFDSMLERLASAASRS